MGIAIIALIAGFAIYFNSPALNNKGQTGTMVGKSDQKFIPLPQSSNGKTIDKSQFKMAPEFQKISGYINTNNSQPLTMASLKGKVVLIEFWTYSCINCIRNIPYLIDWNNKYADKGLVIVGIHSPEFNFEKNSDNLKDAIQRYGIKYPVLQDNDKETWNTYENKYWPRNYLIDAEGYIRYNHIGEGNYSETENVIKYLLSERVPGIDLKRAIFNNSGNTNNTKTINHIFQSVDFSKIKTPDLYLGYGFTRHPLGNPEGFHPDKNVTYTITPPNSSFKPNTIYLEGQWKNNPDNMELQSDNGVILLNYSAKSVNLVAGGGGSGKSQGIVYENNSWLFNNSKGVDIGNNHKFIIDIPRLYSLVNHQSYSGNHLLLIVVKGKGFQAFVFTFG